MPPWPEKIEGQPTTTELSQARAERRTAPGLQMEARVTAPTWEIGLSAILQDFTPGEEWVRSHTVIFSHVKLLVLRSGRS